MSGYVPNIPKAKREAELKDVEPVDIHAERWAEYERRAKQPAKPAEKIKLALRIGVFFDGTGNNATNTALGLACGAQHPIEPEDLDASCKPYMADPASSYGNDVTNIRKLMELYLENPTPLKVTVNKNSYYASFTSKESALRLVTRTALWEQVWAEARPVSKAAYRRRSP